MSDSPVEQAPIPSDPEDLKLITPELSKEPRSAT
jgi:hypothetical protein